MKGPLGLTLARQRIRRHTLCKAILFIFEAVGDAHASSAGAHQEEVHVARVHPLAAYRDVKGLVAGTFRFRG